MNILTKLKEKEFRKFEKELDELKKTKDPIKLYDAIYDRRHRLTHQKNIEKANKKIDEFLKNIAPIIEEKIYEENTYKILKKHKSPHKWVSQLNHHKEISDLSEMYSKTFFREFIYRKNRNSKENIPEINIWNNKQIKKTHAREYCQENYNKISEEKQIIAEIIKNNIDMNNVKNILDIGSNTGEISQQIRSIGSKITFCDPITLPKTNYAEDIFVKEKFEDAKINEKYDLILANHVWGHFWENTTTNQVLEKIFKHKKEDGRVIITYNTNKGYIDTLTKYIHTLVPESTFDNFKGRIFPEKKINFWTEIITPTFFELADLCRLFYTASDEEYNNKFFFIENFMEQTLYKPKLIIEQEMLIVK
ncbi:class I SAM-dependent methyltransferase [Candidatus Woesearchaeota archaeon]|nr:class I SAM-dependent methyltransferase [Candidatus Woesearchaeota archaeon]MCF7901034.1 class I SAM-dependent methyltransferase [Candidatus Woesearchaeota archaeon]MCF8013385.1 class I SAM-dependent methyltransferase [Candidatus Woesearchaeota archaeon]